MAASVCKSTTDVKRDQGRAGSKTDASAGRISIFMRWEMQRCARFEKQPSGDAVRAFKSGRGLPRRFALIMAVQTMRQLLDCGSPLPLSDLPPFTCSKTALHLTAPNRSSALRYTFTHRRVLADFSTAARTRWLRRPSSKVGWTDLPATHASTKSAMACTKVCS